MLKLLPAPKFPLRPGQFDPLMDGVVQLNLIDGALTESHQRSISILLHTMDLYLKSKGRIDYRGQDGRERLKQDAMTFCGPGNPVAQRHGDLAAAHLAIDWSDTMCRWTEAGGTECGLTPPSPTVNQLIAESRDLLHIDIVTDKRINLLLDYLGKRHI